MAIPREVLTIGHSTHTYERFLELLRAASVTAIADVRTTPYSRHLPQFSRDNLRDDLRQDGIAYAFLGDCLGGRPKDTWLFRDGVADYERIAQTESFAKGLDRITEGAKSYRIAMMCSEHDPLDCHRCLLVGRALHERSVNIRHILLSGEIADHSDVEQKLLELAGRSDDDLFEAYDTRLAAAYRKQASRVAYTESKEESRKSVGAG